jgi:hypothetical protein
VEAELHIRRLDQLLLGGADLVDDLGDILGISVLIGQFQVTLEMPGFTLSRPK